MTERELAAAEERNRKLVRERDELARSLDAMRGEAVEASED
jgi:hypothetical protein